MIHVVFWSTVYHVPRRLRRGVDPFDAHKAWQDHLDRLAAIDRLYPSRYGLYLKDRAYPITDLSTPAAPLAHLAPLSSFEPRSLKGIEYEPDNKPHWGTGKFYWAFHARNHPPTPDHEQVSYFFVNLNAWETMINIVGILRDTCLWADLG